MTPIRLSSFLRWVNRRPLARLTAIGALAGAIVLTAAPASGTRDAAGAENRSVRTEGTEVFKPNEQIASTLRFSPGHIAVKRGDSLTLRHSDETEAPHTLSIVNANEVPADIDTVFACGEPGTICDEIFSVFGQEPPGPVFVEGPGTRQGIDGRLDSLFVPAGGSISEVVTAPRGTTLHFMCGIHPWMQGDIKVE